MSRVVSDLIAYLDAIPAMAEVAGTDLFEGGFTEAPDNQVCLIHYSGGEAERSMSASLTPPDLEIALVSLLVRNTTLLNARGRARSIHTLLDNLQGLTGASGTVYHLAQSLDGEPSFVGVDANHRWVYSANFEVKKARG